MTKEHLNEIMAGLCRKLKIRKSDLVAVHEAGMVAQGIDSNAIPYGLDFLLLNGAEDGADISGGDALEAACLANRFADKLLADGRPAFHIAAQRLR